MDSAATLARRMARDLFIAAAMVLALTACWLMLSREQNRLQGEAASMLETAGLQRSLSQQIALIAIGRAEAADPIAFRELGYDLERAQLGFRQVHARLSTEAAEEAGPLNRLYADGPGLTERVAAYLDAVDAVLKAPSAEAIPAAALHAIGAAARGGLMLSLDEAAAAQRYQIESAAQRLQLFKDGLVAATVVLMASLGGLLFLPLIRHVRAESEALIEARDRMKHGALHDPLTGLPNRRYLTEVLELTMAQAKRHEQTVGILLVDLDHFKAINDTYGHAAGDAVLIAAAKEMSRTVRKSDFVARTGGDEFVIVSPDCPTPGGLGILSERLIERLKQPIAHDGHTCRIGASIGVALAPPGAPLDHDRLMMNADIALYEAKNEGRSCYRVFGTDDEDQDVAAPTPLLPQRA